MTKKIIYYRSLGSELRERFGGKLYKIALDGGFTCPNRDGTLGVRGCSFCLAGSFYRKIRKQYTRTPSKAP